MTNPSAKFEGLKNFSIGLLFILGLPIFLPIGLIALTITSITGLGAFLRNRPSQKGRST